MTSGAPPGLRVHFLLPNLVGGGAERVGLDLSAELARRGLETTLVVGSADGAYRDEVGPGVDLVDLGVARMVAAVGPLACHLRATRPDVLVSALTHANVAAVVARGLARVATRVVAVEQLVLSEVVANGLRRERLLPLLARRTAPRADAVVACSEGVARDLVQVLRMDPAAVTTIPNPVITPALLEAAAAEPEPPLPARGPVILGAGRLVAQKGFDVLVRAFAALRGDRRASLVLLGEGPERRCLEALATSLGVAGDVHFLGFVPNPYALIDRADVFALSSRYEGMPNVLVAALRLGTPIVATDCPTGPRDLLADGRHGILVPVDDVDALTDGLARALDSEERDPPPEVAWERFTLAYATDRYLELFSRL